MRLVPFALWLLFAVSAFAQSTSNPQELVAREFGPEFSVPAKTALLTGDLDGDGHQDMVIVASSKDPLLDEAQFRYKVLDPYDAYFGFGDPKITGQFNTEFGSPTVLLILHNWAAPKSKFVLINVPFDQLALGRALLKKKVAPTIRLEERTGETSFLYWTGKIYKWTPANRPD